MTSRKDPSKGSCRFTKCHSNAAQSTIEHLHLASSSVHSRVQKKEPALTAASAASICLNKTRKPGNQGPNVGAIGLVSQDHAEASETPA